MSKYLIRKPRLGAVLSGPKKGDLKMSGPRAAPTEGRRVWKIGPILNQGEESACVGFGWTQYLLSEPFTHQDIDRDQGSLFIYALEVYREAQKIDDWEGEEPEYYGTSVEAGHNVLADRGLVSADMYFATSIGQICEHLGTHGPVAMGTNWTDAMFKPDEFGYLTVAGRAEGGHCFLCYGFDAHNRDLMFANSWGEEWGNQGRFKISFSEMQKLLDDGGYGVATIENP